MRQKFALGLAGLAVVAMLVTGVSLIPSNEWWIQILDFPRVFLLAVIAAVMLGCAVCVRRWQVQLLVALTVAAAIQLWRVYPYVPFAPTEVALARSGEGSPSCFSVLSLNVLQHNRQFARTRALLERERPDVVLLMETDDAWATALAPVLAGYAHRSLQPLDNTYGLIFATNLQVVSARTDNITDKDTPTLFAQLVTRDGTRFDVIGLHPRPPLPGQDTELRDRKILHAARAVDGHAVATMALGDFNDVAWSPTTQHFKREGGFLDPRIGRGSYPTFPSRFAWLGWPLDQLFVSPAFTFQRLRILEDVGSDHRPMSATLCLDPAQATDNSAGAS